MDRGRVDGPVLVVEDDPELLDIFRRVLEDEGLAVTAAADGHEARWRLAQQRPALVVLDMLLADSDGEEVAAALRACHGRDVPIVVVSANPDTYDAARRIGAAAYLRKPFALDELLDTVYNCLRDGASLAGAGRHP